VLLISSDVFIIGILCFVFIHLFGELTRYFCPLSFLLLFTYRALTLSMPVLCFLIVPLSDSILSFCSLLSCLWPFSFLFSSFDYRIYFYWAFLLSFVLSFPSVYCFLFGIVFYSYISALAATPTIVYVSALSFDLRHSFRCPSYIELLELISFSYTSHYLLYCGFGLFSARLQMSWPFSCLWVCGPLISFYLRRACLYASNDLLYALFLS
jgi:hypothetical protein